MWKVWTTWIGKLTGALSEEEVRALLGEGALLVDVRSAGEYGGGHLDGAVNLPVAELAGRLDELGDDRSRAILLYCRSGARSSRAASIVRAAGFERVHNIGSMARWQR